MNDEILKRLDVLGAKLGVAAEHLWQVLIRQAFAEAMGYLAWVMFWVVAMVLMWYGRYRLCKPLGDSYRDDDMKFWTAVWGGILTIAVSVIVVNCLTCMIQYLVNPEFYALQQILSHLK